MAVLAAALVTPCWGAEGLRGKGALDPGRIRTGPSGEALAVVHPEFRPAGDLRRALSAFPSPGLRVELIPPLVAVPRSTPEGPLPPPVPGRLLLRGSHASVRAALEVLHRLDRPAGVARVCLTIAEVFEEDRGERGGSVLFDRGVGGDAGPGIFRSADLSFEPESFLRREILGVGEFQGTSLHFGDDEFHGGRFDAALRVLSLTGSARSIARPHLILTEGKAAHLEVTHKIPRLLIATTQPDLVLAPGLETVGLKLRLSAAHITAEEATIDIDLWISFPVPAMDPTLPFSWALAERVATTRVHLRDGEPLLFGGLTLKGRGRDRRRAVPWPAALDPLGSSVREGRALTLWFLAAVRIRSAGPAAMLPVGSAATGLPGDAAATALPRG